MKNTWKNFKDNITGKKGLLSIGFADITGSAIAAFFWLYIATQLSPEIYGEIIYFISIAGLAQTISLIGTSDTLTVYTAKNIKIQSTLFLISISATAISLIIITIFYNRILLSSEIFIECSLIYFYSFSMSVLLSQRI